MNSQLRNCLSNMSKTDILNVTHQLQAILNKLKEEPKIAIDNLSNLTSEEFLKYIGTYANNEDFLLVSFLVYDEMFNCLGDQISQSNVDLKRWEAVGKTIINLHFSETKLHSSKNLTLLLLTSLTLLSKITEKSPVFLEEHISEVLGISRAYVCFGIEMIIPQKVLPTQQPYYESSADELDFESGINGLIHSNKGGKVLKIRKPRSLAISLQKEQQLQQQNRWLFNSIIDYDINAIKTSDSEISETEGIAEISLHERQKRAKVRLLAIGLLGIICRRLKERRILYSYWHAFFENHKVLKHQSERRHISRQRCDLLYIALRDPNTRCRSTVLQIAAQLIFTSKNFLLRGEYKEEHCPTAFLPFAYNLGLYIISLYEDLNEILNKESSISVLIPALKCLSVLIQSTSFENFIPSPFVASVVKHVQGLIKHKDSTIQVAALMVIEFLVTIPELTPDICVAFEIPYVKKKKNKIDQNLKGDNMEALSEIDNAFEEFIDSENEELYELRNSINDKKTNLDTITDGTHQEDIQESLYKCHPSWLLQCIFKILNTNTNALPPLSSSLSVRIESLQVLCAMSQHLIFIQNELDTVATCIRNAINDPLVDIRICAARCVDTIAYQINLSMWNDSSIKQKKILEENSKFWNILLPFIMIYMRKSTAEIISSVKVHFCDALSNIGSAIFECQPYTMQMNLIGLLSGIASDSNDDMSVRSAAVRALAVYVLYPSLKNNLVLIENTADLALRLMSDSNVLVRIKASWALANISTALLINRKDDLKKERISDDLLWRLIIAITSACDDKHKVRCNAVRTLGNLLCLLNHLQLEDNRNSQNESLLRFQSAILKLIDCLHASGPAKVKWNTCYVIGNVLRKCTVLSDPSVSNNFDWQSKLYPILANIIVHNQNFKVRINAASALSRIAERSFINGFFESLWIALLDAIEQSHHINNFYEYNHQYQLQERLCLALSHLLKFCLPDEFIIAQKHLETHLEIVQKTWTRVANRIVPERSAWLLSCVVFLHQKSNDSNINFTIEQRHAINFLLHFFKTP